MRIFTLFVCFLCFTMGCAPRIDYIGRTLPPTQQVELYFDLADLRRPYEIIGKASGQAGDLTRFSEIQERIIREAKKRGADAVVLTGWNREVVGVTSNTTTNASGTAVRHSAGDSTPVRTSTTGWNSSVVTTASQTNQVVKLMHADFIRYR